MNKYIKIEWQKKKNAIPKYMIVDESTVIDEQFVQELEYNSDNKVLAAYFYEPEPKYLILNLTNQLRNGNCRPTLILELTPTQLPKDLSATAVLKNFGLHKENEIVFDIIRSVWQGYWSEQGNMLFYEEYAENAEEEPISILELIMSIMSTLYLHTYESRKSVLYCLQKFWEN